MKKLILLIFYLTITYCARAQTYDTTRVVISQTHFEELKANYLKISKTKLFKKYEQARGNYLLGSFACSHIDDKIEYEKCLYQKHGNKGAKKIIKSRADWVRFEKRLRKKYPDIFNLYDKASVAQKAELLKLHSGNTTRK
ncbi:MAG: hypothetical protein J0M25_14635 [Flavobacteriales bacterium]|nr:hypothetical protein [Flavobacteriales bacterium]